MKNERTEAYIWYYKRKNGTAILDDLSINSDLSNENKQDLLHKFAELSVLLAYNDYNSIYTEVQNSMTRKIKNTKIAKLTYKGQIFRIDPDYLLVLK